MPNSPPSHCSPDTYRYSLVFRWAADTAEMWKPLVAFRYRMLRTTWQERAFHCHTPEYHCLPTSSWVVHRAATKKSKFSELFCYPFLRETSKADRSGWSWKPARTLMKEMSHGRLMSPSPCQRVAEGGGITAGSVHIKMPWKVLKAGVALRQKHL